MLRNNHRISDTDKPQTCRLCLAKEEELIYIFDPCGYEGFRLWEIIKELLQVEVSKEDGLPWTICRQCVGKVKEFKKFKTMCIHAKITFLTMIASRGLVPRLASGSRSQPPSEPKWTVPERPRSQTSQKCSDGVEVVKVVKEEAQVSSTDEGPPQQDVLSRRGSCHGPKKVSVKEEVSPSESLSEGETTIEDRGHNEDGPLDEGASSEASKPLVIMDVVSVKKEVHPEESPSGEDAFYQDYLHEDVSTDTRFRNAASIADPLDVSGVKEEVDDSESLAAAETYNREILRREKSSDEGSSNVLCLPLAAGDLCSDEEEVDRDEPLEEEDAHSGDNLVDNETPLASDASVVSGPQSAEHMVNDYNMIGGSRTECEKIVDCLSGESHEKELKINSRCSGVVHEERSPRAYSTLSSVIPKHRVKKSRIIKERKRLKSKGCIEKTIKPSQTMLHELQRLETHEKRHTGCSVSLNDNSGVKGTNEKNLDVHIRGDRLRDGSSTSVMTEDLSSKGSQFRNVGFSRGSTTYRCDTCGKGYKKKSSLSNHLHWHGINTGSLDLFKCDACGKEYRWKSQLSGHMVKHSTIKPFECKVCGKAFKSKCGLQNHSVFHVETKPFKCDLCGKKFKRQYELKGHSVVHSELRAFQCEECGKKFKRKSSLRCHAAVHRDLKPFSCKKCGKQFKYKSSLWTHTIMHRP